MFVGRSEATLQSFYTVLSGTSFAYAVMHLGTCREDDPEIV